MWAGVAAGLALGGWTTRSCSLAYAALTLFVVPAWFAMVIRGRRVDGVFVAISLAGTFVALGALAHSGCT